ncbi:motility protein A [Spirochaeta lutea]|uniref:Flagellar motor protein MotP n=1 Tax=Spirochaeta lutea TaxID=1480694 RepID=A0A098R176_9SPIO|nr:motility protein A [Spirochaeta lutea]KGE73531.1 flagellar motor protein MotP [Spirochaeta lutea]
MDLGTVVGMIVGFGMVVFGIFTGGVGIGYYIDPGSVLIVVGGSIGSMLISAPLSRTLGLGRYFGILLNTPNYQEAKVINDLVAFAERARREGLLALEDNLEEVEDEFMRKGIQLVVDGTDPEIIKNILYTELNQIDERHQDGIEYFGNWGSLAPAFGMIGTLIGLIAMLANLEDQAGIAQGMATALITTLYGSMMANIFLLPFRNKLTDRNKYEMRQKEIVIEGILSIQSGDNPRILLEKLLSFLPPGEREPIKAESSQA